MLEGRCSHCIKFDLECTHADQTATTAGSPANFQTKVDPPALSTFPQDINSEAAVRVAAIVTSEMTAYILEADLRQGLLDVARYARHLEQELTSLRHSLSPPDSPESTNQGANDDADNDIFVNGPLAKSFERFGLEPYRNRYFGKSSHIELIKTVMNVVQIFNDDGNKLFTSFSGRPCQAIPILGLHSLRWPYLYLSQWEHADLTPKNVLPPLIFPDLDLLRSLVSDYFAHPRHGRRGAARIRVHAPCYEHPLRRGVVLLLNVWGGREDGFSTGPQKCLQDLETCLCLFGIYELRDILAELLRAMKIDRRFVPNRLKRTLDSLDFGLEDDYCGEPLTSADVADSSHSAGAGVNVPFGLSSGFSIADIDPLFMLPKYAEDLGRLPVYEPFHWMKDPPVDLACWDENVEIRVGDPVSAGAGIFNGTQEYMVNNVWYIGTNARRSCSSWNEWDRNITNIEELVHALNDGNMAT
ncbi:hypothetical protein B0H17DRAFT_1174196 [Mycena rosella]|uniref:Uncharacterized protein n=1 Tax=Mycena rosella TaxID=1033263 RepID=A0AAD7H078_MYCRO|nr:hypothetical protein B0H17DRAFT_1174196 [Mycena rosella]